MTVIIGICDCPAVYGERVRVRGKFDAPVPSALVLEPDV
jgi:hypothetical protein